MEELDLFKTWDNWQTVETDYAIDEYGEVLEMIKKIPAQDSIIKHYSQYAVAEYWTGCTIMSGINALATTLNKDFTAQEIAEVYGVAKAQGWVPWTGRSRWAWWNAVRKRWNAKNPTNQYMLFTIDLFSDEYKLVIEKLWIMGISINVDSEYWKDARDNLVINKDKYWKSGWHATTMMKLDTFKCVDSVPAVTKDKGILIPMLYTRWTEDKIKILVTNGNIRKDAHIIVFNKWLNTVDKSRITEFRDVLVQAIALNSKMYDLSDSATEKTERKNQNDYNRKKLAIINSMLS